MLNNKYIYIYIYFLHSLFEKFMYYSAIAINLIH